MEKVSSVVVVNQNFAQKRYAEKRRSKRGYRGRDLLFLGPLCCVDEVAEAAKGDKDN